MVKHYTLLILIFSMAISLQTTNGQAPVINSATPLATSVEQYGKFEVKLDLTATYANPYDYGNIRVAATFTAPDGSQETVDGFFIQEYQFSNLQTGAIATVGAGVFKVRFAPTQTGTWQYVLSCTNAGGTGTLPAQSFECTAANSLVNQGFVRGDQTNYLHFDEGNQYIPVGENMAWQQNNIYLNYKNWLDKLSGNGGNFIRLWMCHWGIGLEWKGNGYEGLKKYKQNNSFYLDWLLDYCADKGVYVMLCLNHHGQVSSGVNPNWSESPYNAANGGPCQNTWDFFTNATAKAALKNRLRYTVARWGYQRSVMAWELFNEVDWTDQFEQHKADVSNWHGEMAHYLKQTDVRQHLVTSSYAQDFNDANTWNQPDIDFTQTHYYLDVPHLEEALAAGNSNYLDDFGKPTLNGEFGLGGAPDGLPTLDPSGIYIHNSLWGSLLSGGMGAGMSWWWDTYWESQNLYTHLTAVSEFAGTVPLREKDFRPAAATVSGAPGDLELTPVLGWSALADTSFTIAADGSITPSGAALSQFLYGSQWNTQYRRPPIFHVNYPQNGTFALKTGSATGTSPKITIWVDGVQQLNQNAAPNQTYSVTISAGSHTIKVDNTGTDWISISSYTFAGLGSSVDAYVLKSADQQGLAGWVLNRKYNHQYVKQNGAPDAVEGATIHINGVGNGTYTAKWYDCLSGTLGSSETVTANNGALTLAVPSLLWDLSFEVSSEPVRVEELAQALDFQIFPNPITADIAQLTFGLQQAGDVKATLLDASGRAIQSLFQGAINDGDQQLALQLRKDLPKGIYWVKMETEGKTGVKAVAVE